MAASKKTPTKKTTKKPVAKSRKKTPDKFTIRMTGTRFYIGPLSETRMKTHSAQLTAKGLVHHITVIDGKGLESFHAYGVRRSVGTIFAKRNLRVFSPKVTLRIDETIIEADLAPTKSAPVEVPKKGARRQIPVIVEATVKKAKKEIPQIVKVLGIDKTGAVVPKGMPKCPARTGFVRIIASEEWVEVRNPDGKLGDVQAPKFVTAKVLAFGTGVHLGKLKVTDGKKVYSVGKTGWVEVDAKLIKTADGEVYREKRRAKTTKPVKDPVNVAKMLHQSATKEGGSVMRDAFMAAAAKAGVVEEITVKAVPAKKDALLVPVEVADDITFEDTFIGWLDRNRKQGHKMVLFTRDAWNELLVYAKKVAESIEARFMSGMVYCRMSDLLVILLAKNPQDLNLQFVLEDKGLYSVDFNYTDEKEGE